MGVFDEEEVKPAGPHEIGQDLSLLSVDELEQRIAMLNEEIVRLRAELDDRGSTRKAAEALFR